MTHRPAPALPLDVAPPLAPRYDLRPGGRGHSPERLDARWAEAARRPSFEMLRGIQAALRSVSDEPYLAELVKAPIFLDSSLNSTSRVILERAADLAQDSGASWTPLLDAWADRSEPSGRIQGAAPLGAVTARFESWLASTARPSDLEALQGFSSVYARQAISTHFAVGALGVRQFDAFRAWALPGHLWTNAGLTAQQRERIVTEAALALEGSTVASTPTDCPLRFLDVATGEAAPRALLTPAQFRRLADAVAGHLKRLRQGSFVPLNMNSAMDAVRLAHTHGIPDAVAASLLDAFRSPSGGPEPIPQDVVSGLVRQPTVSTELLRRVLVSGRLHSSDVLRLFLDRPDVLALPGAYGFLPWEPDPKLLSLAVEHVPADLFPDAFRRLMARSPQIALSVLAEGRLTPGAQLAPDALLPLLTHKESAIRTRALLLVSAEGPAARLFHGGSVEAGPGGEPLSDEAAPAPSPVAREGRLP